MKLILTKEVTGLGKAGDVVNVKDGYARNYLLPRGNAILWSKVAKTNRRIRRARKPEKFAIFHTRKRSAKLEL